MKVWLIKSSIFSPEKIFSWWKQFLSISNLQIFPQPIHIISLRTPCIVFWEIVKKIKQKAVRKMSNKASSKLVTPIWLQAFLSGNFKRGFDFTNTPNRAYTIHCSLPVHLFLRIMKVRKNILLLHFTFPIVFNHE